MSFRDGYHPKFKSDLKKLDKSVAKDIHDVHLLNILNNPTAYEELHGDLAGIVCYHFKKNKVEYRAAYHVNEPDNLVYFLATGKRENFYEILKRRLF